MDMYNDIERVLVSKEDIAAMVKRIGAQISEDYKGQPLVVLGVLKGGFVFMADLIRAISIPMELDFIAVSSYGASTKSSGVVRLIKLQNLLFDLIIKKDGRKMNLFFLYKKKERR